MTAIIGGLDEITCLINYKVCLVKLIISELRETTIRYPEDEKHLCGGMHKVIILKWLQMHQP